MTSATVPLSRETSMVFTSGVVTVSPGRGEKKVSRNEADSALHPPDGSPRPRLDGHESETTWFLPGVDVECVFNTAYLLVGTNPSHVAGNRIN